MASPIFKVLDPRMDLRKPTTYAIEDGARLVNFEVSNTASAGAGGSSMTWTNANPPDKVVIDKKIIVSMTYVLHFTRTDAPLGSPVIGYEALPGYSYNAVYPGVAGTGTDQIRALGTDGPRFLPIAQTTNVLNVIINNSSANGQLFDYIEPLMRYTGNRDYFETQLSQAPCVQDQFQAYGDFLSHGASRNVLGAYGENSYNSNRGGHPLIWIQCNELGTGVPGNVTHAIVYVTSFEPIFVSPCDFGIANQRGFYGVKNFRVTMNTTGDLSRVWSHNDDPDKGGWPITLAEAQIIGGSGSGSNYANTITYSSGIAAALPALFFTYLSPKILMDPPEFNVYPYYYLDDQVFPEVREVASLATTTYKTSTFDLTSVPKYMYIYVRKSNPTRKFWDTDTYAFINNLSITFANNANQLSNAQPNQLYQMSVKNGCQLSWAQWSKHVGSVVCIDFSQDISLPDNMFVGMSDARPQISVQVQFTNLTSEATPIKYSIYCIPSYAGVFDITEGQAQTLPGIVSLKDYLAAPNIHTLDYTDAHNFYGGNFYSKLRDVGNKAKKALQVGTSAAKFAVEHAPKLAKLGKYGAKAAELVGQYGPDAIEAAELLGTLVGAGMSKPKAKEAIRDGSYVHILKAIKKAKKGGAQMGRKQMNNTLLSRAIGY